VTESIPVAGAVIPLHTLADPLVVEADPESEATRCFKNIARFVFRLVQEIHWSGRDDTVSVRVVGDAPWCHVIAMNVGALLASLLDVAVESSPLARTGFDIGVGDPKGDLSPRDRLWLVASDRLASDVAMRRFDLSIGTVDPSTTADRDDEPVDLGLVMVPQGRTPELPPDASRYVDVAAVIIDAPTPDHPEALRLDR
jgi:hypothetical protein